MTKLWMWRLGPQALLEQLSQPLGLPGDILTSSIPLNLIVRMEAVPLYSTRFYCCVIYTCTCTQDTCSPFLSGEIITTAPPTWDQKLSPRFRAPRSCGIETNHGGKKIVIKNVDKKTKKRRLDPIPVRSIGPLVSRPSVEMTTTPTLSPSSIGHTTMTSIRDGLDILVQRSLGDLERRRLPFLPSPLQLFWGNAELDGVLDCVD